ncbi:RNA-binding S4 domain-containing protein [Sphingomicrobium aquimarinum]|uniref:RNA-binding S4 domain-containing protein n=1 Tax=Sphingomicrobium aquimarinum TaxID=3133971 RepID=UPI003D747455
MKTRGAAQRLVAEGRLRIDRERILKPSHCVAAGSVLTFPLRGEVRVLEILDLPERRGPPAEARAHYRLLDENANQSQEKLVR